MITATRRVTASLIGLALGSTLIASAGTAAAAPAKPPPAPATGYAAARNIAQMPTVSQGVIEQTVINVSGMRAAYEVSCAQTPNRVIYRIPGTGAVVVPLPRLSATGEMEIVGLVGKSDIVRSGCLTDAASQDWSSLLSTYWGTYTQSVDVDSIPPSPAGTLHALLPGQRPTAAAAAAAPTPALLAIESRLGPDASTAPNLDGQAPQTISITGLSAAALVSCENAPNRLIYRLPVKGGTATNIPVVRTALTYSTNAASTVSGGGPATFGAPVAIIGWDNAGKLLADSGCISNSDASSPAQTALAWGSVGSPISGPAARPIGAGIPPFIPTPTSQLVAAHLTPHATGITVKPPACGSCSTIGPKPVAGDSYNLGGGVGGGSLILPIAALILMLLAGLSSWRRNTRQLAGEVKSGRRRQGESGFARISVAVALLAGAYVAITAGSLPLALIASALGGLILAHRASARRGVSLAGATEHAEFNWTFAGIGAVVGGLIVGIASSHFGGSLVSGGIFGVVVGGLYGLAVAHSEASHTEAHQAVLDSRVVGVALRVKPERLFDGSITWAERDGGFVVVNPDQEVMSQIGGLADRLASVAPHLMVVRADLDRIVVAPADAATVNAQRATADSGGHLGGQTSRTDPWAERATPTPAPRPAQVDMTKPSTDNPTPPTAPTPLDFSQDW